MRKEALRDVLLIKAIEENDSEGALIALADRNDASRQAMRELGSGAQQDALLARRARLLLPRIVSRHAFVETVLALVSGPLWVGWLLIALSVAAGFGLSSLDGTRRINILSFPVLGLVLWNFAVYAATIVAAARNPGAVRRRHPSIAALIARFVVAQASRIVTRARVFDTRLAQALERFLREWAAAAQPLLVLRASRALHLCGAAVGAGLVAGLYLRGLVFDYRAGWESTFLDPAQVRVVLSVLYQPALLLTGISLPDATHLATIQWGSGGPGENAGRWIHLLAATVALFVIVPRLLLALLATVGLRRRSLHMTDPADLRGYYRTVFLGSGLRAHGVTWVVPYAYEPKPNTLARLQTLLSGEHEGRLAMEVRPPVSYGDEEAFFGMLSEGAAAPDTLVLLTSLAATPEDENHGVVISRVRDWLAAVRPDANLLVMVNEAPYASRMLSKGAAPHRLDERRSVWREFITARGVEACFADLGSS
jgi:hypothetical protein